MLRETGIFAAGVAAGVLFAVALPAPGQQGSGASPTPELKRIAEAFSAVRANYAGTVDDRAIADGCIAGFLRKQDPLYAYLDRAAFQELQRDSPAGIGLELRTERGQTKVVSAIEGGPADKAGARPGDVIVGVDDTDAFGMTPTEVVSALRGAAGSTVRLTLLRPGAASPIALSMTREAIRAPSVRARLAGEGVGYVRIARFDLGTPDAMLESLTQSRGENRGALKGLVLDLRGNPGGSFPAAVAVAAAFLAEDAVIAKTEGRAEDSTRTFTAKLQGFRAGTLADFRSRVPADTRAIPLAVLVDRGTGSGAEIVAAALQDNGRAAIVGEKTAGAGSIQSIMPFGEGALKLTTAYWQTPKGRAIKEGGITPDYPAEGEAALARAVEILRAK